MKKLMTSFLLPLVCVLGLCAFGLVTYSADLRDWLAVSTWQTTPSTSFAVSEKSSEAVYTYEVNGQEYTNGRVFFFSAASYQDNRYTEWKTEHLQIEQVTVYYDPEDPQRSVLRPEAAFANISRGPLNVLICLAGILLPLAAYLIFMRTFWRKAWSD